MSKNSNKLGSVFLGIFVLFMSGCANIEPSHFNHIDEIIKSGKCYDAETYARKSLEGAELYLALGFNEVQCMNNKKKGIEYLTLSSKLGNSRANEALRELGVNTKSIERPPTPPVTLTPRPPVQPLEQSQRSPVQTNRVPKGFINCTNRGAGVIECVGPRGAVRCTNLGGGQMQCNN
jgi:hypothetical protein